MEPHEVVCQTLTCVLTQLCTKIIVENQTRLLNVNLKRRRDISRRNLQLLLEQTRHQYIQRCAHLDRLLPITFPRRERKMWSKARSFEWWDKIVLQKFDEGDWLENFRMTKPTFDFICSALHDELAPKSNWVRLPIQVDKKVAVALYKLASCAEYRVVGNQFGIHKSTVHKCVYAFCKAVVKVLLSTHIRMPNEIEAIEVATIFERRSGVPQIIGAIDGTHIPILPPSDGFRDYVNRKGWPSYNMQAVVDSQYRFRDITIKHPGCNHDANVLKDSNLYHNPEGAIPRMDKVINGLPVPLLIIGDPAYPLLPWLITGYKAKAVHDPEEESLNVYLSKARIVVENAFGRLKARWRCIMKRNDMDYKFIPYVVATCCVLHNIVENRKEAFIENWLRNVEEAEILFPQPNELGNRELDNFVATDVRNQLKHYMAMNFPLLRSTFR